MVFKIRNKGGLDTSVYVNKYDITVHVNAQTYTNSDEIETPDRFDVLKLNSTENHIIVKLPQDARDWKNGKIILTYSFIDLDDGLTKKNTEPLEIRRYDSKKK